MKFQPNFLDYKTVTNAALKLKRINRLKREQRLNKTKTH
jgi:hypothetical protein